MEERRERTTLFVRLYEEVHGPWPVSQGCDDTGPEVGRVGPHRRQPGFNAQGFLPSPQLCRRSGLEGKKDPIVVDIVDPNIPLCKKASESRDRFFSTVT